MFFSETTTDRYGHVVVNFHLTQGDTGTIRSTPTKNGELIDFDLIDKGLFNVMDADYNILFSKEFTRDTDYYSVTLESSESATLPIDNLLYEVEYTFTDGTVNTPNQGELEIMEQGKE